MKDVRPINGDEMDWCSKNARRLLKVFDNWTGIGKKVKRAMNKRARQKVNRKIREGQDV